MAPLALAEKSSQDHKTLRQTQHSDIAKNVLSNRLSSNLSNLTITPLQVITEENDAENLTTSTSSHPCLSPPAMNFGRTLLPTAGNHPFTNGSGHPPSDTPFPSAPSTAPNSPRLAPVRQNSGSSTPRVRPPATTLNIPGMTKSRISPDGKIAHRDIGSKLVVIMVGLPARGKSYITKKLQRYLAWQQHETKTFNVGDRRRVAAGAASGPRSPQSSPRKAARTTASIIGIVDAETEAHFLKTAQILLNGIETPIPDQDLEDELMETDGMDQTAEFFDPANKQAAQIRERVAMNTLNELLDFLLKGGGSIGILDATNSTLERRKVLVKAIKEREPKLNILFVESVCEDEKLLEANMRLKLRGPDYKGKDPETSYQDFKKRVAAYKTGYAPLGPYEDGNKLQYIQMHDVGRKIISGNLSGFLSSGILSYLSTFNLSPRQFWITRHGESLDNCVGKIGGDSELTTEGRHYGTALYNFISQKHQEWEVEQKKRATESIPLPQRPGDHTPPYPDLLGDLVTKNFCVWTSGLVRSIQTAHEFEDDENYDVKNWEMLNELNAGVLEGLTYKEIEARYPEEYAKRARDKLNYIYPGVGGEGYLQVIARLRDVVREIERIKDHVLLIGHRSVCRVLMAYFLDLTRDDIAKLDIPLGMLYCIEPKPYGVDFHAYKYDEKNYNFVLCPGYKPQKEVEDGN